MFTIRSLESGLLYVGPFRSGSELRIDRMPAGRKPLVCPAVRRSLLVVRSHEVTNQGSEATVLVYAMRFIYDLLTLNGSRRMLFG
jgi:hypothetical protein